MRMDHYPGDGFILRVNGLDADRPCPVEGEGQALLQRGDTRRRGSVVLVVVKANGPLEADHPPHLSVSRDPDNGDPIGACYRLSPE